MCPGQNVKLVSNTWSENLPNVSTFRDDTTFGRALFVLIKSSFSEFLKLSKSVPSREIPPPHCKSVDQRQSGHGVAEPVFDGALIVDHNLNH